MATPEVVGARADHPRPDYGWSSVVRPSDPGLKHPPPPIPGYEPTNPRRRNIHICRFYSMARPRHITDPGQTSDSLWFSRDQIRDRSAHPKDGRAGGKIAQLIAVSAGD